MAVVMVVAGVRSPSGLQRWIFASIAGGALGNGLDRLLRAEDGFLSGEVIDFIDFQWWPIFNVADIAIVCSVIVAIGVSFFAPEAVNPGPPVTDLPGQDVSAGDLSVERLSVEDVSKEGVPE